MIEPDTPCNVCLKDGKAQADVLERSRWYPTRADEASASRQAWAKKPPPVSGGCEFTMKTGLWIPYNHGEVADQILVRLINKFTQGSVVNATRGMH